jgi:glycosyltransferase involved in cell wall biosynthesis
MPRASGAAQPELFLACGQQTAWTPMSGARVVVVIPAFDEEDAIADVIGEVPRDAASAIVVVDNASTDATAERARAAGADVVFESRRGYGQACLTGIARARSLDADVIVFLDGDWSDFPAELPLLTAPIVDGRADFVVGSRMRGRREPGAMLPQALVGNRLACALMRLIWGARYTDLGPFRAIRLDALDRLGMADRTFGWTIEMQIRAAQYGLRTFERPVSYRKRVGVSKITGTLSGTVRASYKILSTIARFALQPGPRSR